MYELSQLAAAAMRRAAMIDRYPTLADYEAAAKFCACGQLIDPDLGCCVACQQDFEEQQQAEYND